MKRLLPLAALLLPLTATSAEPGFFGFALTTSITWTMDVESATVRTVIPGSPAAKAGLVVGDSVVAVEGCAIPGCGALKAEKMLEKPVGEALHLKLKRANGTVYDATVIAGPRPRTPA